MQFFRDILHETEEDYQNKVRLTFYNYWKARIESCITERELKETFFNMHHDLDETMAQAIGPEREYRLLLLEVCKNLDQMIMQKKEGFK